MADAPPAPRRRPARPRPCAAGARGTASVAAIFSATALPAIDVLERPALLAGEDGRVDLLGVLLAAEDHAAAGAAERLVDRRRDDVGVRARGSGAGRRRRARRSAPCRPSAARRPRRRSRGSARSPACASTPTSRRAAAAGGAPWRSARPRPCRSGSRARVETSYGAMSYSRPDTLSFMPWLRWPPCGQRQAHDRVAGLQQRVVDGGVGLRAGVRLDVGVLGAEQRLGAVDRELLDDVDVLAAAVVALARVALGVLVGQHGALRTRGPPAGRSSPTRSSRACAAGAAARRPWPRRPRGRPRRGGARRSRRAGRSCDDASKRLGRPRTILGRRPRARCPTSRPRRSAGR